MAQVVQTNIKALAIMKHSKDSKSKGFPSNSYRKDIHNHNSFSRELYFEVREQEEQKPTQQARRRVVNLFRVSGQRAQSDIKRPLS